MKRSCGLCLVIWLAEILGDAEEVLGEKSEEAKASQDPKEKILGHIYQVRKVCGEGANVKVVRILASLTPSRSQVLRGQSELPRRSA